jgi:hypothetical protein
VTALAAHVAHLTRIAAALAHLPQDMECRMVLQRQNMDCDVALVGTVPDVDRVAATLGTQARDHHYPGAVSYVHRAVGEVLGVRVAAEAWLPEDLVGSWDRDSAHGWASC